MSILFKLIERREPGVQGGRTTKFYATAITNGEINIEILTSRIEKISIVSGADIRAVLCPGGCYSRRTWSKPYCSFGRPRLHES